MLDKETKLVIYAFLKLRQSSFSPDKLFDVSHNKESNYEELNFRSLYIPQIFSIKLPSKYSTYSK